MWQVFALVFLTQSDAFLGGLLLNTQMHSRRTAVQMLSRAVCSCIPLLTNSAVPLPLQATAAAVITNGTATAHRLRPHVLEAVGGAVLLTALHTSLMRLSSTDGQHGQHGQFSGDKAFLLLENLVSALDNCLQDNDFLVVARSSALPVPLTLVQQSSVLLRAVHQASDQARDLGPLCATMATAGVMLSEQVLSAPANAEIAQTLLSMLRVSDTPPVMLIAISELLQTIPVAATVALPLPGCLSPSLWLSNVAADNVVTDSMVADSEGC